MFKQFYENFNAKIPQFNLFLVYLKKLPNLINCLELALKVCI